MYKAYKFRLYPNNEQRTLLHKTFGFYRFIYNYFLDKCRENKVMKAYDMCSELKEMYIDYPWLKEVDSCILRCAIFNLEDAYQNFFSKRSGYPVFKNKKNKITKVRQRLSELKSMENNGYLIDEVGSLGGND